MIASDYTGDGTEADALHTLPLDTEECAECERTSSMLGRSLLFVLALVFGVLYFAVGRAGGN